MHGFDWVQGSLYVNRTEDLAKLFAAITALKTLVWLPPSVRDIRAFRVEQWSDFYGDREKLMSVRHTDGAQLSDRSRRLHFWRDDRAL